MSKVSRGFTLIEVMVAVAILAFTATAAIKLVILAQNTLRETKQKRLLCDRALEIQTEIRIGKLDPTGMSGDILWETADKEKEMFNADFGKLNFDRGKSGDLASENVKWRELTVKIKDKDKITLCLPAKKEGSGEQAESVLSSDSKSK